MKQSGWPIVLALFLSVAQLLLTASWCVVGAGLYGSPLGGMSGEELAWVWSVLAIGPFFAFPAALITVLNRRLGAACLVVSGLTGCLAMLIIRTGLAWTPVFVVSILLFSVGAQQFETTGGSSA
jgi:hypothetical protein